MTLTIQEKIAQDRAQMHQSAVAQAKKLRDQVVDSLRSRLASIYHVMPYNTVNAQGTEYFGVRVKVHQCKWFDYSLGFRVENESRYMSSMPRFACRIVGSRYERNRRSFTPLYEADKKGQYNFVRMAEDIERAHEAGRIYHERNAASTARRSFSEGEFTKVCEQTGVKPFSYSSNSGELDIGKYRVVVSAGDFYDGKVKVQVSLRETLLSAEEAVSIIRALRNA